MNINDELNKLNNNQRQELEKWFTEQIYKLNKVNKNEHASAKIKRHPCMRGAARITFLRRFAEFVRSFAWMPQILYHCYS